MEREGTKRGRKLRRKRIEAYIASSSVLTTIRSIGEGSRIRSVFDEDVRTRVQKRRSEGEVHVVVDVEDSESEDGFHSSGRENRQRKKKSSRAKKRRLA